MFLIIENSFCSKGQAKGSELTISIAKKETSMNIPHKQAYLHIPLVTSLALSHHPCGGVD